MAALLLTAWLPAACARRRPAPEWFDESLHVRPLPSGALVAFANLSVAVVGHEKLAIAVLLARHGECFRAGPF